MAQELIYTSCGYYLIPDIRLSYTSDKPLGKYGRMHRAYLEFMADQADRLIGLALEKKNSLGQ